ncbi:phage protein NinX family protein [Endozoicomonas sp. GU-1]|uniref:phage protein NinX family protein n=1 Tax=Endozoicomonas sp. GU-1 TaxID=3009078 RepID=UPI0022B52B32|nr:phage protein NinX family protein [Endozoicomonas sp. GU-1]WBA79596.1 DUF2591 family protein [Endozoicomonas sp. GU-1]
MENNEINKRIAEIEGKAISSETSSEVYIKTKSWPCIYNPAEDWAQGGKLIEKYKISLQPLYKYPTGEYMGWYASLSGENELVSVGDSDVDESPLKAAMLAIIDEFAE